MIGVRASATAILWWSRRIITTVSSRKLNYESSDPSTGYVAKLLVRTIPGIEGRGAHGVRRFVV